MSDREINLPNLQTFNLCILVMVFIVIQLYRICIFIFIPNVVKKNKMNM